MMRERAKMNAMRSGLVVFGSLAFGYLTLRLGFKPFLENAQRTMDLEQLNQSQSQLQDEDPIPSSMPDSHQHGGDRGW